MYILILLCLCASGVSAVHDRSDEVKPKVDSVARVAHLNKYLPKSYHCCKDGQMLWGYSRLKDFNENITCMDGDGKTSNISLTCSMIQDLDADLASFYRIEFYVEDGVVIVGDHKFLKYEVTSDSMCFGNQTEDNELKLISLNCVTDDEETEHDKTLFARMAMVSIPFSVLTIVVYVLLPELRDLHGSAILCLCCSFTMAQIMVINTTRYRVRFNNGMCRAGGLVLYYSILASFFWMNVIALQQFVSIRYPKLSISWRKQFKWYSLYAWGVPGLLLFCVMIAEMTPGGHVLPGMGMNYNCWFNGKAAKWTYYLGPMTLVLTSNVILFLASVVLMYRQKSGSDYKKLRYKFILSLRLFIVVGVTWFSEPLQMVHGTRHIIWVIADCWNLLQGVIIFLVLVVLRKRAVLGLLSRGYLLCLTPHLQAWIGRLADEEQNIVENSALEVIEEEDIGTVNDAVTL